MTGCQPPVQGAQRIPRVIFTDSKKVRAAAAYSGWNGARRMQGTARTQGDALEFFYLRPDLDRGVIWQQQFGFDQAERVADPCSDRLPGEIAACCCKCILQLGGFAGAQSHPLI